MPKEKDCTKLIPRIYKKNAENIMLFTFVNAQRQIVPTVTLEQAIWNYFRFTGIDDWDMESARITFHQIQKEYYEDLRSETTA
jgi:hypothetical protein